MRLALRKENTRRRYVSIPPALHGRFLEWLRANGIMWRNQPHARSFFNEAREGKWKRKLGRPNPPQIDITSTGLAIVISPEAKRFIDSRILTQYPNVADFVNDVVDGNWQRRN